MKKLLNKRSAAMAPGRIKYIIFDLGGVLIKIHPEKFYYKYPALKEKSPIDQEILERRMALGHEDPLSLLREIVHLSQLDLWAEDFIRSFTEDYLGETIPEIEDFISSLPEKKYSLCLLSNTNRIHFEHVIPQLPCLKDFHRIYLSYELHMVKPEADIFSHIIHDLKARPEEILLIDDNMENINAAKKMGMQAIKVSANHPEVAEIRQYLA